MRKVWTFLKLCHRRFIRGDRVAGFYLLLRLGGFLYPGYRFLDPRLDWWDNRDFDSFLRRFDEEDGLNAYRKWTVTQLLRLTRGLPGDTAECGVYKGATSQLICASNLGTGKTHHLFDSFEGLSAPGPLDGDHWREGDLVCPEDRVRDLLASFDAVRYHKGWIPDRFVDVADLVFSFVHIDVDLAEPTAVSLAFFYPRTSEGGIIVCDDYGHSTCPGSTRAVDEFLADKPESMLSLPAGGGFLVRGREADPRTRILPGA